MSELIELGKTPEAPLDAGPRTRFSQRIRANEKVYVEFYKVAPLPPYATGSTGALFLGSLPSPDLTQNWAEWVQSNPNFGDWGPGRYRFELLKEGTQEPRDKIEVTVGYPMNGTAPTAKAASGEVTEVLRVVLDNLHKDQAFREKLIAQLSEKGPADPSKIYASLESAMKAGVEVAKGSAPAPGSSPGLSEILATVKALVPTTPAVDPMKVVAETLTLVKALAPKEAQGPDPLVTFLQNERLAQQKELADIRAEMREMLQDRKERAENPIGEALGMLTQMKPLIQEWSGAPQPPKSAFSSVVELLQPSFPALVNGAFDALSKYFEMRILEARNMGGGSRSFASVPPSSLPARESASPTPPPADAAAPLAELVKRIRASMAAPTPETYAAVRDYLLSREQTAPLVAMIAQGLYETIRLQQDLTAYVGKEFATEQGTAWIEGFRAFLQPNPPATTNGAGPSTAVRARCVPCNQLYEFESAEQFVREPKCPTCQTTLSEVPS